MRYISLSILCLSFLFSSCKEDEVSAPSSGTISGKVYYKGKVVAEANVFTTPASESVLSNATGDYTLQNVVPGDYVITARVDTLLGSVRVRSNAGYTTKADIILGTTTTNPIDTSQNDTSTVPSPAITNGLFAYLPFNGNTRDASVNKVLTTNSGSMQYAANRNGKANSALYINGSSTFVEIPDRASLRANPKTFSFWVRPTVVAPTTAESIFGKYTYPTGTGYVVAFENRGLFSLFSSENFDSYSRINVAGVSFLQEWKHITLVCTSTNTTIFFNGVRFSSASYTGFECLSTSSTVPFRIGLVPSTNGLDIKTFTGLIDEFYIFDRALSDSEINTLYTSSN